MYDRLIDLSRNPLATGREDPMHPGILEARIPGTDVLLVFDLDVDRWIVYVVSISKLT